MAWPSRQKNCGFGGILCLFAFLAKTLEIAAAQSPSTAPSATNGTAVAAEAAPHYNVRAFTIQTTAGLPTNPAPSFSFSGHIGTNAGLSELIQAASDLQMDYGHRGFTNVGVAMGEQEITNGIVTMHVFEGAFPQIVISGKRYISLPEIPGQLTNVLAGTASVSNAPPSVVATNTASVQPKANPMRAGTLAAGELASVQEALRDKIKEVDREERRAEIVPPRKSSALASTNGPVLEVKGYEVIGNTLLPTNVLDVIFQPYIGTNITFDLIRAALTDLQAVYRDCGYVTVSVALPPQTLTNGMVKMQVFEGRLSEIRVVNNHHFSSNNVMRALPSLRTNTLLINPVFQAELDRANANQDRQIYPQIEPGVEEKTTLLRLSVKDQLPLHAKLELNNQNPQGSPDLRISSSAVYNNLWQLEHSLGVQYGFSPELFKSGQQWDFYDLPLVANYSGFYRMPLGNPPALADVVAAQPGGFGYSEATRKFNLPPPSGRPELNIFASGSTVDTGLNPIFNGTIYNTNGNSLYRKDVQQDLTVNNSIGGRLTFPLESSDQMQSSFSFGPDYKTYSLTSSKTNILIASSEEPVNGFTNINSSTNVVGSQTSKAVDYLPISLHYDLNLHDALGSTSVGLGLAGNAWYTGSRSNLHGVTGSTKSSGHWVTLTPSLTRDFLIRTNWTLSLHAEAQWANEPLISTEQFGVGGVANVRGYQEGEAFGDTGWRVNAELKTPAHVVGTVGGKELLTIRGSIYTDLAEVYLLDPQGRNGSVSLWGTGFGGVASLGATWQARFLFSWPLMSTSVTEAGRPRFNFGLAAQF